MMLRNKKRLEALDAPTELTCPIDQDGPMIEPYLLVGDGRTYEKESIEAWLKERKASPVTGDVLENTTLVENRAVKDSIERWCLTRDVIKSKSLQANNWLIAAETDNQKILKKLRHAGADISVVDKKGNNALQLACQSPTPLQTVAFLLTLLLEKSPKQASGQGGDEKKEGRVDEKVSFVTQTSPTLRSLFEQKNQEGNTVLHTVAKTNNLALLTLLLEQHESTVDSLNEKGESPLHIAAKYRQKENVLELMQQGATIHLKDKQGRTPLDVAGDDLKNIMIDLTAKKLDLEKNQRKKVEEKNKTLSSMLARKDQEYKHLKAQYNQTIKKLEKKIKLRDEKIEQQEEAFTSLQKEKDQLHKQMTLKTAQHKNATRKEKEKNTKLNQSLQRQSQQVEKLNHYVKQLKGTIALQKKITKEKLLQEKKLDQIKKTLKKAETTNQSKEKEKTYLEREIKKLKNIIALQNKKNSLKSEQHVLPTKNTIQTNQKKECKQWDYDVSNLRNAGRARAPFDLKNKPSDQKEIFIIQNKIEHLGKNNLLNKKQQLDDIIDRLDQNDKKTAKEHVTEHHPDPFTIEAKTIDHHTEDQSRQKQLLLPCANPSSEPCTEFFIVKRDNNPKQQAININLIQASINGNMSKIHQLILNGADVNYQTKGQHVTPLMFASVKGQLKAVKYLVLKGKADTNQQDQYGMTALMYASANGNDRIARFLSLKKGKANIDQKEDHGATALIFAIINMKTKTARCLMQNGADVNLQEDINGVVPLIFALHNLSYEILSDLIRYGADVHIKNKAGKDAVMIASDMGSNKAEALLKLASTYKNPNKKQQKIHAPVPSQVFKELDLKEQCNAHKQDVQANTTPAQISNCETPVR